MASVARRPIQTERLLLVPAAVSHAPAMFAAVKASTRDLLRWMPWVPTATFESTLSSLSGAEQAWLAGAAHSFTITLGGEVIGRADARRTANDPGECNLGYWIADAAAGKGYMTEAVHAVLEFAFQALGLGRAEMRAHVDNRASQRVAEKLGARREGVARNRFCFHGTYVDAVVFSLVPADLEVTGREDAGGGRGEGVLAPDAS